MLSYQHGYHAGNFADVVKHLCLTRLLTYMIQKDKPLLYLETHSGRGLYDLRDKQALKTGESRQGIELLWEHRKTLSGVWSPYIEQIKALNTNDALRVYPGSPSLALQLLRPQDRLVCCELHPEEFEHLEQIPRHHKRVLFSHSNGFDQLHALLPPPERRGLIFIDPSFEIKTEYREIPILLKSAYRRFATGVYCLWYPILDNKLNGQLQRGLEDIGADNTLQVEFHLTPTLGEGMTRCGLWIINPPYVLASELNTALAHFSTLCNPGSSSYFVR